MKNIILVLKGMIIGVANIIPGVSGGTLMITLGLYEEIISIISHFFKDFSITRQLYQLFFLQSFKYYFLQILT